MKKIFNLSALILMLSLVACAPSEVDDLFDESPAERLDNAVKNYTELLKADGGRWLMQYFANPDMEGINFIMTFHNDGSVDISTQNAYVNDGAFYSDRSLWQVVSDYGPVLSFNTYNRAFHVFSSPQSDGSGYEGDYEFTLMKYSGDTLYIDGKKRQLSMIMTRLPADTDDKTYLDEIVAASSGYFSPKIPRVFVAYPNGERHVITGASSMVMNVYDEKSEDPLTTSFSANAIISHSSFSFMKPLTFGECSAQHFLPQEDGSLLCLDDKKTTISAGDLSKDCFTDTLQEWTTDLKVCTGELKAAIDELNSQLPKQNGFQRYVQSINFGYAKYPVQKHTITVAVQVSKQAKMSLVFYYEPSFPAADQLKLTMAGNDGGQMTTAYYENYSGLRNLLERIGASTFQFITSSRLAPVNMTMAAGGSAENALIVNAK